MPYGVRIMMIGRLPAKPRGTKMFVCSFTPSRMATIVSVLSNVGIGGVPSVAGCWPGSAIAGNASRARTAAVQDTRVATVRTGIGGSVEGGGPGDCTPKW